ncbi:MAG TPA: toll/interleukin-1 receptor domain-containing protein [Vicinamibacterales bacterium]|nr:toll/interleukin-1 receptor domain-containing protein [Vicinamibacterales bacterium]
MADALAEGADAANGDVFISYASDDRARVLAIVAQLKSRGFSIWCDVEELRAGQRLDVIHDRICRSSVFLAMLSRKSLTSRWVRDEINTAVAVSNEGKPLTTVAIRLDRGLDLPPMLKSRKAVDIFDVGSPAQIAYLEATLRDSRIPPTVIEQFRTFVEGLPIVGGDLGIHLSTAHMFANPIAWANRFCGRYGSSEGREAAEKQALSTRGAIVERLESAGMTPDVRTRLLDAIDRALPVPFLSGEGKAEVLSTLRGADEELLALASWMYEVCNQRSVRGSVPIDLVARWASTGDIAPAERQLLESRGRKLLRRAIDADLLAPFAEREYQGGIPPDDEDKWFHIERYEFCRAAHLFDKHSPATTQEPLLGRLRSNGN